ncbi:MAG: outer membrane lipoprotein chaperone LolA [Methylobacillus sp.]|jgi:outer membrane lipoprotein carrier protein|nr:outer membrane lipoprotein chaperone LolA [Methylobacillus sp.]
MRLPVIFLLAIFAITARADEVQTFKNFFQDTTAMRAKFHQTVLDNLGRKVQEVNGTMQLQRPGKFRWDYEKPYVQMIVSDGKQVWMHDPELNQVTVRALDKVIGSSPAALLAGSKEIDKVFNLQSANNKDGLSWVIATPKEKDSGFERVELGFKGTMLQQMSMRDSFDQTTVIEFSAQEINPKLDEKTFSFTPPAGADVLKND